MYLRFKSQLGTLALILLFLPLGARAQQPPLFDNLGSYSMPISTENDLAARYFDQGMRLYFAFNHAEAIRAFDAALSQDETCAMCYWGIAMSYGPNINLPMDPVSAMHAHENAATAQSLARPENEREAALIDAIVARFANPEEADRTPHNVAYADAMRQIRRSYPKDVDVATLFAESLMDINPWNYWEADGSPRPGTEEALASLEFAMSTAPEHPGANHFYIHAVEKVDPWRAVEAAERLAGLMPGAGHLVHMPGHIYIRVGRYEDAITANEHAVHADETYIQDQRPEPGVYVAGYYPHNYDFLAFAASMVAHKEKALQASEKLRSMVPVELATEPGMTFLQHHVTRHLQFKVRFSDWQSILGDEMRTGAAIHERGMWHYARGRALLGLGRVPEARAELDALQEILTDESLADLRLEFNVSQDVLGIAANVLRGFVLHAEGQADEAVEALRHAALKEDALTYGEPPDWTVPVRQDLGAVLLDLGRVQEARDAFREDLERFPDNAWSVNGLARAENL